MFKHFSCNGELLKTYKDCYFIHFEYKNDKRNLYADFAAAKICYKR